MDEQRRVSAGLGCGTLIAVFFLAITVYGLAYQTKPGYFIQVGARIDRPYLVESSFFTREPPEDKRPPGQFDYRFTRERSEINLPGLGSQPLTLTLRVNSSENPNPTLKVYINEQPVPSDLTVMPGRGEWKELVIPVQADYFKDGNMHIRLESSTWEPRGDSRKLGILLDWVKIDPASSGFLNPGVRPPDETFIPLLILTIIGSLSLVAIGLPALYTLLGGLLIVAGFGFWLTSDRISLTTLMQKDVLRVSLFVLVAVFVFARFGPAIYRTLGIAVTRRESGWLAGFFLLSFVLLYGGQVHPQFTSSDIGLNVNILQAKVMNGVLVFTEKLPNGQPAPYPPGYYIGLLPFTSLLDRSRESFELLFKISSSILQASGVYLVFYLAYFLRQHTSSDTLKEQKQREKLEQEFEAGTNWAGICAAGLYSINKFPFLIFSQGNHANLLGEWAFLLCLSVVTGVLTYFRTPFLLHRYKLPSLTSAEQEDIPALSRLIRRWSVQWRELVMPRLVRVLRYLLPFLVLSLALLSHYGTFLFINVYFVFFILLMAALGGKAGRHDTLYLVAIYFWALALVFLVYYYNHLGLIFEQFGRAFGDVPAPEIEAKPRFEFFPAMQRIYNDTKDFFGIPVALAALGGAGLWIARYLDIRAETHSSGFSISPVSAGLTALAITSGGFALLERVQGLETRYQLYLLPLVALAAGAFLGRVWRSGFAGVLLVTALFLFQFIDTLSFWLERITYYFY